MVYRRLSSDGDYTFGQSKRDFISGREAVAQAVTTRLRLLFGEWWEDQEDGLPLFQSILGVNSKQAADLLIRQRILETPNVTGITRLEIVYDSQTRKYTFDCSIDTAFGEVALAAQDINKQTVEVVF